MADNENNPRNPESPLFKRLTRLFSGPIVNYRTQTPRSSRRRQLDKFKFTSTRNEGWGITHDNKNLIVSDGSEYLHFWNPETKKEVKPYMMPLIPIW